ncbi:MAG TPA: tetratricopeptide repeat protein [Trebonia sp.]|jgi:tetratricopeptide (TPR) repeat protein|nr:tetratricopeptide repeat protein [Trebonia sp.]
MARLLDPGERLERWVVVSRHLGNWGVVYVLREVERGDSGRPEVLIAKAMRPELAGDAGRMNRFEQECNTWLALGLDKHIARLFFVDRFDSQVFAFGEYVGNGTWPNTLRGWLDGNLVELELALRFGLHVLRALDFARGRGVVAHLDLKPENVLVTGDGVAKVTDWGLSRRVPAQARETAGRLRPGEPSALPYRYDGADTLPAGGLGTRGYAAPEVAAADYVPAPAADVFSFGVMLGEMLTGRRLPPGTGAAAAMAALRPLGARHRAGLGDLLAGCLAPGPQDRPRSTAGLAGTLAAAFEDLTGLPAEPAPGPAPEAPSDLGQRAYGLMMLGRTAEGLALQAEAMRRARPDDEKLRRPMVMVMDYKEHGWQVVVDEALLARAEDELRAAPADAGRVKSAASLYQTAGRLERALELGRQWLELSPGDPAALDLCAGVLARLGRRREALDHLDRAIASEATAARWQQRARVLADEGDLAGAAAAYERAVGLDPGNAQALNGLGHVLAQSGDHERAVTAFQQATEREPGLAVAWYNLGTTLTTLGRRDAARAALLTAVEADPENAPGLNTLGVLARLDGDEPAALALFRRATEADPGYAKGWFNAGNVYAVAGQYGPAREAYERALAIDPGYANARTGLDQLAEMGW